MHRAGDMSNTLMSVIVEYFNSISGALFDTVSRPSTISKYVICPFLLKKVKKGCNFKVKDSLLKTLEETQKRDMIMLLILDGSHWQLVCINFLHREINYFDSLGSDFCAAESLH